jgi:hypothetical protein
MGNDGPGHRYGQLGTHWGQVLDLQREVGSRPLQGPGQSSSYQVACVGGAGTLLGDTHAEAGQAAFRVASTQMEVVGPAVAAGEAFYLGLRWMDGKMCAGNLGISCTPAAFETSCPSHSGNSGKPSLHPKFRP